MGRDVRGQVDRERGRDGKLPSRVGLGRRADIAWHTSATDPILIAESRSFFFPAIALPLQEKTNFECPQAHIDEMRRAVRQMTHLLIVGWRGSERHFVRELAEQGAVPSHVLIACKGSDASAKDLGDDRERIWAFRAGRPYE